MLELHYHTICMVCESGNNVCAATTEDRVNGELVLTMTMICASRTHDTSEIVTVPCRDMRHLNVIITDTERENVTLSRI